MNDEFIDGSQASMNKKLKMFYRKQYLKNTQIMRDVKIQRINLQRSMIICQGIEKVLDTYKFYDRKTRQVILIILKKREHLNFQCL